MAQEISIKISTHNTSSTTEIYLQGVNNHVIRSIYQRLQCFHVVPPRMKFMEISTFPFIPHGHFEQSYTNESKPLMELYARFIYDIVS